MPTLHTHRMHLSTAYAKPYYLDWTFCEEHWLSIGKSAYEFDRGPKEYIETRVGSAEIEMRTCQMCGDGGNLSAPPTRTTSPSSPRQ